MAKQAKLLSLLRTAQSICEQLEIGQAETPLLDRYTQQIAELESAPLTVVLLAMTPASLSQTLKWLYGDVFNAFSVSAREWPQFMEISITDGTYGFGMRQEKQRSFEEQEAFQDALKIQLGATRASVVDPLGIAVNNVKSVAGLKLLVPDSPDSVLSSPEVLNAIIAQSNFVIVAAPLHYVLSREDHQAVETLTANMAGFWPLLTVDELSEEVTLPEIGWWEQHTQSPMSLPPKLITQHIQAAIPEILTHADNAERQTLVNCFHAQRLSSSINAVFARYQQQAAVLEKQVARGNELKRPLHRADNQEGNQLRQLLDEWIVSARKDLAGMLQDINLPNSPLTQAGQTKISALQLSDLDTETAHSVHKLTLGAAFVADLRNALLKQSKAELSRAVEHTNQHLTSLRQQADEQLKAHGIAPLTHSEKLDANEMQNDLERRLELSINYRGEVSKRTLATRLGESRRLIMGLSMVTMVLGGVANALLNIDLRSSLMTIAPLILVGGFIYTYFQWPKEDAEKLNKELDRIRDALVSELRRLTSDIQRFAQQQMTEALDESGRNMQKAVQQRLTKNKEHKHQQQVTAQQAQQQRNQKLEAELRHWQAIKRNLERLKADAAELERNLSAAMTS